MFKQVRVVLLENFSLVDLAWREFENQAFHFARTRYK